jgi:hypothetical protein
MPSPDIRSLMLTVIEEKVAQYGDNLQTGSILQDVFQRVGSDRSADIQKAILTQWHELFRTGYLAWGMNLSNTNPPFFHVTAQGRRMLARLSRDPGNPAGYLAHVATAGELNPVARSYLEEGLNCFVADLYKSSAIMVGAAAEIVLLDLRDNLVKKLQALGREVPNRLQDWKLKVILNALESFFDNVKSQFDPNLRDEYEAYWPAFNQFIRSTRNEAGHPKSVDPISNDSAHAAFLIFPEQVKLANRLNGWVSGMA